MVNKTKAREFTVVSVKVLDTFKSNTLTIIESIIRTTNITLTDDDSDSDSGEEETHVNNFVAFTVKSSETSEGVSDGSETVLAVGIMSCSSNLSRASHFDNGELSDEVLQEPYETLFVKWVDESNAFLKQMNIIKELEACEADLLEKIAELKMVSLDSLKERIYTLLS